MKSLVCGRQNGFPYKIHDRASRWKYSREIFRKCHWETFAAVFMNFPYCDAPTQSLILWQVIFGETARTRDWREYTTHIFFSIKVICFECVSIRFWPCTNFDFIFIGIKIIPIRVFRAFHRISRITQMSSFVLWSYVWPLTSRTPLIFIVNCLAVVYIERKVIFARNLRHYFLSTRYTRKNTIVCSLFFSRKLLTIVEYLSLNLSRDTFTLPM